MNSENWFNQIKEDTIYHYTGEHALSHFILGDKLLLTHFSQQNDCAELEYGRAIFDKSIPPIIPERFQNYSEYLRPFGNIKQCSNNCFTFSFSTKKDMVSLWALYASNGGYAIEFSSTKIKESLKKFIENNKRIKKIKLSDFRYTEIEDKFHFDYCNYDKIQSANYCRDFVKSILSNVYASRKMDDGIEFALQLSCIQEHIIPFFKHKSFADESEIRIACSGAYLNQRVKNIDGKLRFPLFPVCDAITKVIVSPHGDVTKLYDAAVSLQKESGLNFEIEKSDSTYRVKTKEGK